MLLNPNHLGNFEASGFAAGVDFSGNATCEVIGCVGFQPQLNPIETDVYVEQPSG